MSGIFSYQGYYIVITGYEVKIKCGIKPISLLSQIGWILVSGIVSKIIPSIID